MRACLWSWSSSPRVEPVRVRQRVRRVTKARDQGSPSGRNAMERGPAIAGAVHRPRRARAGGAAHGWRAASKGGGAQRSLSRSARARPARHPCPGCTARDPREDPWAPPAECAESLVQRSTDPSDGLEELPPRTLAFPAGRPGTALAPAASADHSAGAPGTTAREQRRVRHGRAEDPTCASDAAAPRVTPAPATAPARRASRRARARAGARPGARRGRLRRRRGAGRAGRGVGRAR